MRSIAYPEGQGAGAALAVHRYTLRLSNAIANAYLWLFLFQYFALFVPTVAQALIQTLLLYALSEVVALLLTPFAAAQMRGGMRRGMIYAVVFLAAGMVYAGVLVSDLYSQGAVFVALLLGAYRALYRIPYAVEHQAVQSAAVTFFPGELLLALAPLGAGLFLSLSMYPWLYAGMLLFAGSTLALISLIPLARVPNVHEQFSWGYRETFGRLLSPLHRKELTSSVASGLASTMLFVLLPIFGYLLLARSYLALGALFSAVLLTILLARFSGERVMVEHHADSGHYIDELTALKAMGAAGGRLVFALALALALAVVI